MWRPSERPPLHGQELPTETAGTAVAVVPDASPKLQLACGSAYVQGTGATPPAAAARIRYCRRSF